MKKRVIARGYYQSSLYLHLPLMAALYLKVFEAPQWAWGAFWTWTVIQVVCLAVGMHNEEPCAPVLQKLEKGPHADL